VTRRRARARRAAFLLLIAAAGCATSAPPVPPALARAEPEIESVAHRRGDSAAPSGPLRVTVRMAKEPDLASLAPPAVIAREDLELAAAIVLASGALAALGCAICLSNAVVAGGFGLVYLPLAAVINAADRAQVGRIQHALAAVDFAPRADEAMRRFLGARAEPGASGLGATEVELVVIGYGFAPLPSGHACFFLDSRLRVTRGGGAPSEDAIVLGPFRRSDDAPPPHCSSRSALDSGDGQETRLAAEESAEILAAIAASRLAESL
jgi:hypothetical protein